MRPKDFVTTDRQADIGDWRRVHRKCTTTSWAVSSAASVGFRESGSGSAALTLAMSRNPPCAAGLSLATRFRPIASMGFFRDRGNRCPATAENLPKARSMQIPDADSDAGLERSLA